MRTLAAPLLVLVMVATPPVAASDYPYQSCFELAARLHDVPLEMLLAVAATESNWDPDARSHADAHGIMQIQWPGTARHLGVRRVSELYNPCLNIELGARYLRELLDRNGGDADRALAAYNYGPTRIDRSVELPAGAQRYVDTVAGHRRRIEAGAAGIRDRAAEPGRVMRFDHGVHAKRYAVGLNARIDSARFEARRGERSGWEVRMEPGPDGLSLLDARTLGHLGWMGEDS